MKYDKKLIAPWLKYPKDVLQGKITAGKYIKLACQRYLNFFERDDIFFDVERMQKIENFINHMKHFQGRFAGKPFLLLPFQKWVLASIFGFYYTDDPEKRVTEYVVMFIARKNAKTALSAAILLAEMCINKEASCEVYLAANTREQAKIALGFIKGYSHSLDPRGRHFKQYRDYVSYPRTNSICRVLSAEAGVQDGLNPSVFLIDEEQAAQTDEMFQVLKSGQAMRQNPISIIISSGGYLMDGFPFYTRIQTAHQQLDGQAFLPDSTFYALFEMDEGDSWADSSNYIKANPSLGEIVKEKFLLERLQESKLSMTTQVDFKIKNLDIFVTAKNIWLEPSIISNVGGKVDYDRLLGEPCYMGCDLSSVNDLTSIAAVWAPNPYREYEPDRYIVKVFCWVPQCALEGPNGNMYSGWIHSGYLKMTSGNSVDYEEILRDVLEFSQKFPIMKFHYDAWNSSQFIQQAVAQGVMCVPMSQSLGSFNRSTKSFEVLAKSGRVVIDLNPLISWAFQNCELKVDSYGNCKPVKANGQVSRKIDPVIAILSGLAAHLFEQLYGDVEMITLEQ